MKKILFSNHKIFLTKITNKKVDISTILNEFKQNSSKYKYTHYINKRWENIYLSPSHIPSVLPLLSNIQSIALEIYHNLIDAHQTLIIPHELLGYEKNEFWFNTSTKGQSTRIHNHHQKSIISGVYYLEVPKNSANLFFKNNKDKLEIESKKGRLIFFPSELDHYVLENKSEDPRISLAFNFYKFPLINTINSSY